MFAKTFLKDRWPIQEVEYKALEKKLCLFQLSLWLGSFSPDAFLQDFHYPRVCLSFSLPPEIYFHICSVLSFTELPFLSTILFVDFSISFSYLADHLRLNSYLSSFKPSWSAEGLRDFLLQPQTSSSLPCCLFAYVPFFLWEERIVGSTWKLSISL